MDTAYNFAPYLKALGNNRYDLSYQNAVLRKLWTEMKIHVYFLRRKEGRKGRDRNST